MGVEEKSFPRGGVVSGEGSFPVIKKTNLFDQKKKKQKTKKRVKHHVVTGSEPKLTALEDLSYKVLSEGMLVLGRITEITDYYLYIALPGLVTGRVPVTQVSEPYSHLLQSMSQNDENLEALCPLTELFYKGQLVTAQVWQIRKTDDNHHIVSLSLDPRVVHSSWSHVAMAKEGLIFTAAVKSKEEHGYVMDCGVSGLRAFLKADRAKNYCDTFNEGRPLAIGQLVRCVVMKGNSSSVASSVQLSADPNDISQQEENGCISVDMQNILPGMRFKLSVADSLRDGFKVKFHSFVGYLHHNHIPYKNPKKGIPSTQLQIGGSIFGRVLYVTPIVKNIFLSAVPCVSKIVSEIPKPSPAENNFRIGDIVDHAKVTNVGVRGIHLHIGKKDVSVKGFVPERRLGFNYKGKIEEDEDAVTMMQRLKAKFPLGSSVRCRLLHYDSMIETFVCSMEKSVLLEKYLTYSDVQIGGVVPCVIDEIKNGGIAVKVGMLSGFVPAAHSADVPLHQPAKKFHQGLRVTGRVLKVEPERHRLIITLKQSLVSSDDPIITSYQSARTGLCYTGTVVAITSKGVFVSFFGDAKGFIENKESFVPKDHKFFLGQLVRCYVIRRSDNQIRLSLNPLTIPKPTIKTIAHKKVTVGQPYTVEVVSVKSDGLEVKITDKGEYFDVVGLIPILQLSDRMEMCPLLLNTFEVGTVVSNVWCFSNGKGKGPSVFSMRSSVIQFFKSIEGKIATKKLLEAVCPGWILPCTIQKVDPSYLLLEVPLASVKEYVKVAADQVCDENGSIPQLGLVEGQGIQAKVLKVIADKNTLVVGCKESQLWNGELETCVMHLSKYLFDQQRLQEFAKKAGSPLGAFWIGRNVSGIVSEKTEWGFVLQLDNGVRGEATFFNAQSDDLDLGMKVNGKVLNVDFVRGHVEVTLNKKVCTTLSEMKTMNSALVIDPDSQLRGSTLLVTPEFILVQLKGAGKHNLAYIPTYLYPYASSPLTITEPFFGIDRKVIVKRCSNGIIVCLSKEVVEHRKKQMKKKLKIEERKGKRKVRYFDEKIKTEDIKEEENSDEEIAEETKTAKRILDTRHDIKITDKAMDEISEDELIDLSDSETDLLEKTPKKVISVSLNDEDKQKMDNNTPLKTRKRKSSDSSEVNGLSIEHEDLDDPEVVLPSKKKKEKVHDSENSNPCTGDIEKKAKKKKKHVDNESNDDESNNALLVEEKKNRKRKEDKLSGEAVSSKPDSKKKKTVEVIDIDIEEVDHSSNKKDMEKPTLANPGFMWDIDPTKFMQVLEQKKDNVSSDSDSDSDDAKSKKKKRKKSAAERKEAARLEEERLQKVERDLLDPNRQLSSCDDFDRLVLANPDNSAVWLQYMAFHLQATEIEKARAVAQRAIKSISYREEQEKLNVWLGLLNLENLYGTSESLKSTLEQALQANDPYKVRAHMVRMYAESGKIKDLESEVRLVVKKFKETPGMWHEIGSILMSHGHADKARSILQQALPHMKSKKESVSLVVQFALMEARNNNLEQAKALMDPILASYPQRVDVWSVYSDMLVKANQISEARDLLERAISQKMPARKMKTLFTKFLQFEEAHGSKEGQERVRSLAADYVKQVAGNETIDEDE